MECESGAGRSSDSTTRRSGILGSSGQSGVLPRLVAVAKVAGSQRGLSVTARARSCGTLGPQSVMTGGGNPGPVVAGGSILGPLVARGSPCGILGPLMASGSIPLGALVASGSNILGSLVAGGGSGILQGFPALGVLTGSGRTWRHG